MMANRHSNLPGQSISPAPDKASILIICLWVLFILATFAVYMGYGLRQKLSLARRLEDKASMRFIAEAGIRRAIAEIKKEPEKSYSALNEAWSNNPAAFKQAPCADARFDVRYDYADEQTQARVSRWGLEDEESKINLNRADRAVLGRLFKEALALDELAAQELAASIVDWRDADSQLSIPLGSAEDLFYRGLAYPYEAKDAEFQAPEELFLVRGMTGDIFERLKGYITVYGSGRVNVNTASRPVLASLGLNRENVDKILAFRAGADRLTGTDDDNIFESVSSIVPKLSQSYSLSEADAAQFLSVADLYLAVKSDYFTARSIATYGPGKYEAKVTCAFDRSGKVLSWREAL